MRQRIGAIAFPSSQWYDCDMKAKVWFNKAKSSLEGIDFSDIWENRVQGPYGNQVVNFIDTLVSSIIHKYLIGI